MPLENRKRKTNISIWECFDQSLNKYIPAENKIMKNKKLKTSCGTQNKYFQVKNLKFQKFTREYGR